MSCGGDCNCSHKKKKSARIGANQRYVDSYTMDTVRAPRDRSGGPYSLSAHQFAPNSFFNDRRYVESETSEFAKGYDRQRNADTAK